MAYVQLASGTVIETSSPEIWPEAKRITAKDGKAALYAESADYLRSLLSPVGTERKTVTTLVTHVARSGMSRNIRCFVTCDDGLQDVTDDVARLIGARVANDGGLVMVGCGSDMGFKAVYHLGLRLWPQGTPEPHSKRNGEPDRDGGYAIRQRWL